MASNICTNDVRSAPGVARGNACRGKASQKVTEFVTNDKTKLSRAWHSPICPRKRSSAGREIPCSSA